MPPGPPSAPAGAVGACALDALLNDLGPRLRRGEVPQDPPRFCASGLQEVDRALGGGFPRGRVGEIIGPASSGRTSLALSILATASRAGEFAAVVDPCDVFDPPSAEAAGVDLSRILWVRATERRAWLRSTEQLLEASGFSLVVLDVAGSSLGGFPLSVWPRLTRAAAASQTSLIVLGSERVAGTFSALTLELDPARPCFSGAPLLFEGLQGQLHLVRNRTGPSNRFPLWVRLRAEPAATTASLGSARSASPTSAGSLSLAASLRAPIGACGPVRTSGRPRRGA